MRGGDVLAWFSREFDQLLTDRVDGQTGLTLGPHYCVREYRVDHIGLDLYARQRVIIGVEPAVRLRTGADHGMFNMFDRTGAPTLKGHPHMVIIIVIVLVSVSYDLRV